MPLTYESKIKFLNAENKQAALYNLRVGGTVQVGVQPEDGAIKIIKLGSLNPNGGPGGAPTEGSLFYIETMPTDPGVAQANMGSKASAAVSKRQSS